jgi:hypothetical protein
MKHFPTTLLAFVAFATTTQAQTFKETLRWMHNTASYEGGGYHGGDKTIMDETEVPLSNTCSNFVIIQTIHYRTAEPRPDHVWKITMNLSAIEPNSVKSHAVEGKPWSYVDIGTTNDEDAIHTPDGNTSGVGLYFNGTSYAPRFAKALRHAVVLCGGKASSF